MVPRQCQRGLWRCQTGSRTEYWTFASKCASQWSNGVGLGILWGLTPSRPCLPSGCGIGRVSNTTAVLPHLPVPDCETRAVSAVISGITLHARAATRCRCPAAFCRSARSWPLFGAHAQFQRPPEATRRTTRTACAFEPNLPRKYPSIFPARPSGAITAV